MRKVIFTTIAIFVMAVILTGFQKTEAVSDKYYGGSASVSVVVYEVIYVPGGTKRGKELATYTLNANADCRYDDVPAAKKALADDLEYQKNRKGGLGKEAVISGSIKYDVNSCDK